MIKFNNFRLKFLTKLLRRQTGNISNIAISKQTAHASEYGPVLFAIVSIPLMLRLRYCEQSHFCVIGNELVI